MTGGRDDEIVFLTGCREHPSVPIPPPAPPVRRKDAIVLFAAAPRRHRTRRRKLYLADMAVMLVVMALASLVMRDVAARLLPAGVRAARPGDYAACAVPLGIAAARMLIAYRLLGPRNPDRSPLREPGFVAGMMLALTACLSVLVYVVNGILYDLHIRILLPECGEAAQGCTDLELGRPRPRIPGDGVLPRRRGALRTGGDPRLDPRSPWCGTGGPGANWIDLAGLALGVGWIAASVACLI